MDCWNGGSSRETLRKSLEELSGYTKAQANAEERVLNSGD